MYYKRTGAQLKEKLTKEGFSAYPSMPNKYWDPNGRIIWTDGNYFQIDRDADWQKYDEHKWFKTDKD